MYITPRWAVELILKIVRANPNIIPHLLIREVVADDDEKCLTSDLIKDNAS